MLVKARSLTNSNIFFLKKMCKTQFLLSSLACSVLGRIDTEWRYTDGNY